MVELPKYDSTEAIPLADWLEMCALLAPDRNSSRGDLEGALRVSGPVSEDNQEGIEQTVLEVFNEMEERTHILNSVYPFVLDFAGGVVTCTSKHEELPAYGFCLYLSYLAHLGDTDTDKGPRLFESLSCAAAKGYLGGESVGFGFPRQEISGGFAKAVDELCELLGEGGGFLDRDPGSAKDDKLDLAAWKDFPDRRQSKLIMFGQCATGRDWRGKLHELQPVSFWKKWIREASASPSPIKSVFVPHRLTAGRSWQDGAMDGGILFDRCRIAHCASKSGERLTDHLEWLRDRLAVMQQVRS